MLFPLRRPEIAYGERWTKGDNKPLHLWIDKRLMRKAIQVLQSDPSTAVARPAFYPQTVWFIQEKGIISWHVIFRRVFVIQKQCVCCEAGKDLLHFGVTKYIHTWHLKCLNLTGDVRCLISHSWG